MYHEIELVTITTVIYAIINAISFFVIVRVYKMSRRKIKKKNISEEKQVLVSILGETRRMDVNDIDIFLAENMEELSVYFNMELPEMSLSTEKTAKLSELNKIHIFMKKLKIRCFREGILKMED
jgi:Na+-translocating ferredoxin:NAD+ oxidoreductase RnfG subunit